MTQSDIYDLGILPKDFNEAAHCVYNMSQLGYSTEKMKKELLKKFETTPWKSAHVNKSCEDFSSEKKEGSGREGATKHEEAAERLYNSGVTEETY